MAFANSAITDIIATTIQSRSGELADNLTQNNAILMHLDKKGNVRPFSGGNVILEEIMYNDPNTNNANSYSGYEVLNISPDSPISAAQYKIAQYADAVTMSGLEMLQNSSKEAIIDLLDGRMQVSEARLLNRISGDLFLDGTGMAVRTWMVWLLQFLQLLHLVLTVVLTLLTGLSGRIQLLLVQPSQLLTSNLR